MLGVTTPEVDRRAEPTGLDSLIPERRLVSTPCQEGQGKLYRTEFYVRGLLVDVTIWTSNPAIAIRDGLGAKANRTRYASAA